MVLTFSLLRSNAHNLCTKANPVVAKHETNIQIFTPFQVNKKDFTVNNSGVQLFIAVTAQYLWIYYIFEFTIYSWIFLLFCI